MATVNPEVFAVLIDMPIEKLNLDNKVFYCLKNASISTVGDLLRKNNSELTEIIESDFDALNNIRERLRAVVKDYNTSMISGNKKKVSINTIKTEKILDNGVADRNSTENQISEQTIEESDNDSESNGYEKTKEVFADSNELLNEILKIRRVNLDVGLKALRALSLAQLDTIKDIISFSRDDLKMRCPEFNDEMLDDIGKAIIRFVSAYGLEKSLVQYPFFKSDNYIEPENTCNGKNENFKVCEVIKSILIDRKNKGNEWTIPSTIMHFIKTDYPYLAESITAEEIEQVLSTESWVEKNDVYYRYAFGIQDKITVASRLDTIDNSTHQMEPLIQDETIPTASSETKSLVFDSQISATCDEEDQMTDNKIQARNDDSSTKATNDDKDKYHEDVNETILAQLAEKYKTRKLSTVKAFFDENPDISNYKLYYYARMHSENSVRNLLISLGIIDPDNDRVELTEQEQLEKIMTVLRMRYGLKKALSLTQIKDENPDIPFSKINLLTKTLFNKTAKEYLIEENLVIQQEKDTRTSKEKLEEITNLLLKRYKTKPKAYTLKQLFGDNSDINLNSVNTWTREIYGITAKEYYVRIGVMTSSPDYKSDERRTDPEALEIVGLLDKEKMNKEFKYLDSNVSNAVINGQAEDLFEQKDEDSIVQDKTEAYDPLGASILDLNIKGRTYYTLKTAGLDTVLSILQNSKSVIETEYPNIDRDMIKEIDKAIKRLTFEHGCQKLALSFPFFAYKNHVNKEEKHYSDATDSGVNHIKTSLEEVIIEILGARNNSGFEWTSAAKVAEELKTAYPELANKVTPRDISDALNATDGIVKNDFYYKYIKASQRQELGIDTNSQTENIEDTKKISDVVSETPANAERRMIKRDPPEHKVRLFSWEKEEAEPISLSISVNLENTDNKVDQNETNNNEDEENFHDNKDEEINNDVGPQPSMSSFDLHHIIASDYSQERIEEIKDIPIEVLELSVRSYNCLKREKINRVWQLIQFSSEDIRHIRNMGQLSHDEVITKTKQFMEKFDVAEYLDNKRQQMHTEKNEIISIPADSSCGGITEEKKDSIHTESQIESLSDDEIIKKTIETPIDDLGLSVRSYNCLKRAHIQTLGEILQRSKTDLLTVRNLGYTSLEEITSIAENNVRHLNTSSLPFRIKLLESTDNDFYQEEEEAGTDVAELSGNVEMKEPADETAGNEPISVNVSGTHIDGSVSDDRAKPALDTKTDISEPTDEEMISIREAIKVLPLNYQKIISARLRGMTLQEIADKTGVTRARIDQVVSKGMYAIFHGAKNIKPIAGVIEDDERELFEKYKISLDEWINIFHKEEYVYHYLKLRYKRGARPLPGIEKKATSSGSRGLTYSPNGIKGVVNKGRLEDFLEYYKLQPSSQREFDLYTDEEQFAKEIKKLSRRINREIERKKYISDIRVTDHEYTMLCGYVHYAVEMVNKTGIAPDDAMFATAVTNVAIKTYKEGNFWGNFFNEIKIKQNPNIQRNIGVKFYSILEKYDLARVDAGAYVQNILLHCFVSDNYANAYFDFLFNFYRIDLDRDLSRLDTETMRALMDSICAEENVGRTYMLKQHIGQAMAANRRGATIRIRNHMKLLDKFFWDDSFEINTTHRLNNLMQKWARSSKDVIGEMESYATGRRRGARRFSQPYLLYNDAEYSCEIVVPTQSIKVYDSEEIFWKVTGGVEKKLPVEMKESVIGFKVLETKTDIPINKMLDSFQLELCTAEGETIKKFPIRKKNIRFFDDEGYEITSKTIKTGDVTSVTKPGDIVKSSALYDSQVIDDMLFSYFNFEFEDILHQPDGHVIIVGRPDINNSIAGKGRIEGATCFIDDKKYDLYGKIPYVVLRMKSSKLPGTAISINGKRYRLSDIGYESFAIDDKTDDTGYYIDLHDYLGEKNDVYRIAVDIPGGSAPHWEFIYIKDFSVTFDEAPYVFEPRGIVVFPDHISIKETGDYCEREPGINGFKFIIKEVGRSFGFVTEVGEHDVNVSIPVPAFFIKGENGEWDSNIPAPVWHADLPDMIDLAVPYHKITLYMDDIFTDGSDTERAIEYRRNVGDDHILCDITKFKSYLSGDDFARSLRMRFGEIDSNLFTIIIHSKVISLQILGDFDANDIIVNADISGKADYCVDIRKESEVIAEKIPLINGVAKLHHDIGNGIYEVEVFETVEDDSGFGSEDYYSIGTFDQEMMNPYDMTDRSFKIVQLEDRRNALNIMPFRFNYYVFDLKKTQDNHIYNGMMVVRRSFFKGSEIASLPVAVRFNDLNRPNYVWITFADEYGDDTDFLYDTRKQGILQEENSMLRPMVCYRRYTFLNDEDHIYHIDFIQEHYLGEYDELEELIEFPETNTKIVFKEHKYDSKRKRYEEEKTSKRSAAMFAANSIVFVGDAPITPRSRMCLRDARIQTLNELTKMTKAEFASRSKADAKIIRDIDTALKQYGMKFKDMEGVL